MGADLAGFEAFYASPLQHPILLWVAALAGMAWCATRRGLDRRVRRYCAALTVLSLADAWLTSNHVYGLGVLSGRLARVVPLAFVLAGDYRYLLLIGAATERGGLEIGARTLAVAAGMTVIVPALSQVIAWGLPESASGPRVLFLVYEVSFALLVTALRIWHPRVRSIAWLDSVSRFVTLYYALWATADAIILFGGSGSWASDLGFLLRVIPNALYYGGFIAAIGQAASRAR